MAIAAILRRDHHCSGNFLQDGGEEIYRNGTGGSNPACFSGESDANFEIDSRLCHSIEINLKLELDRQKSKQMEAGQCLAGPATFHAPPGQ